LAESQAILDNPGLAKDVQAAALIVFRMLSSSKSLKLTDEEVFSMLNVGAPFD